MGKKKGRIFRLFVDSAGSWLRRLFLFPLFFFPSLFSFFLLFFLNVSSRHSSLSRTISPSVHESILRGKEKRREEKILVTIALGKYFRVIFSHFISSSGNSLAERKRKRERERETRRQTRMGEIVDAGLKSRRCLIQSGMVIACVARGSEAIGGRVGCRLHHRCCEG